ncbi:helix-turn-helix domain-containing protein [Microbacterium karelineae]|uniref:helix-turn-helix domain-containing protein n=1 Tax=Microbacterium karelineae TaxID=2654283 RepID=UPI0012EADC57|nr:helix-turn-helix domain-containing protein [Microbacterium karelineae]
MSQGSSHLPHRVTIIADEGSNPFELACACEVFGARRASELGYEIYDTKVATAPGSVRMRDGIFVLAGSADLTALDDADTIVVPNRPDFDTPSDPQILDSVRAAHARGARLIGLCTGAFTLAEAGLLDDRPATVHWQLLDEFTARYPRVDVRADVLFVDDGDILTSAGGAAALDLALHVVRRDHGAQIANTVSRRLVFSGLRSGGQKQFIDRPVPAIRGTELGPILDWMRMHLTSPLRVRAIAERARVSPATLFRRFQQELGMTPTAWLTQERVHLARRMLEETSLGVDDVAHRSGLGSAANLRAVFRRSTGLSPLAYRQQFSTTRTDAA